MYTDSLDIAMAGKSIDVLVKKRYWKRIPQRKKGLHFW